MNCSFCQGETPGFTEQSGKHAFCDTACQTGFYDQIGVVLRNPETGKWMPKDLIIKQLVKLNFKDLILEYKGFPELKEILDSKEFEIQWLHSFSRALEGKKQSDAMEQFFELIDWSVEKRLRITFIIFRSALIQTQFVTSDLIEYALQFKAFLYNNNALLLNHLGLWAIRNDKLDTFKLLLSNGMPEREDQRDWNLLLTAIKKGRLEFVRLLLDKSSKRNLNVAFQLAAKKGFVEIAKLLLPMIDPAAYDNEAIYLAAKYGHLEIVQLLLYLPIDRGVNPAARDNLPLIIAAENGHLTVVVELLMALNRGVDPAAQDNRAIQQTSNHLIVQLLLIYKNVDPGASRNFAIREAVRENNLEVVKLLLNDPRVDPLEEDEGYSAFDLSLMYDDSEFNVGFEMIKLFLNDPRFDPGYKNNYIIRHAASSGYSKMVELLLKDPRVDPSAMGNAPIRWASQNGHAKVVRLLLADKRVNPADGDNLAIRSAVELNRLEVVQLLLEKVYYVELLSLLIKIAREKGNKEMVDYLQGFNRRMNEGDRKKTKILNKI